MSYKRKFITYSVEQRQIVILFNRNSNSQDMKKLLTEEKLQND